MARFEVLGLDADRELIRSLAKRLAGDGPDSARIRAAVRRTIAGEPPKKGGILLMSTFQYFVFHNADEILARRCSAK